MPVQSFIGVLKCVRVRHDFHYKYPKTNPLKDKSICCCFKTGLSRVLMFFMLIGLARSASDADKQECTSELVGLATCLPYVSSQAKTPTMDCCAGLKDVLQKSKKCLCVLIKDRDDPDLGLKIDATRALGLPNTCHAPANISACPSLLNLAPNSPDAKVFEDFANSTKGSNTTQAPSPGKEGSSKSPGSTTPSSTSQFKSDGGKGMKWMGIEMICGVLIWCLMSSHLTCNL